MFDIVLLAAGRGSRMGGANGNQPKCLMPFKSGTVLSDLISNLLHLSPRTIKIIGGFGYENLKRYIEEHFKNTSTEIELIRNDYFEKDRNIYSALIGQEAIGIHGGVLFFETDTIITPSVVFKLKNYLAKGKSFIGVSDRYHSKNTGGFVIEDESGSVVEIGYKPKFDWKLRGSHRMAGFLYVCQKDFDIDLKLRKSLCKSNIDNYYFASMYGSEHLYDICVLQVEEHMIKSFNTVTEYTDVALSKT